MVTVLPISATSTTTTVSNYYASDASGQASALGANDSAGGLNPPGTRSDSLIDLLTPTMANQMVGGNSLYLAWSPTIWDFGSNVQLPGLIRGGGVLRDGDANGQLD